MLDTRNTYELYRDMMTEFQDNYSKYNEKISEEDVAKYLNNVFARAYQTGNVDIICTAETIITEDWENEYVNKTEEEKLIWAKAKFSFSRMTGKIFNYL